VDAGQALAAAHEVEQRLAARGRDRGVFGIVEERSARAGQDEASYCARFFALMSAGS
jgi:hypothetical protein